MAAYFAADGWNDITVAFPADVHEVEINRLAAQVQLNLLVESLSAAQFLKAPLAHPVTSIEVDAGSGRSGVPWDRGNDLHALATSSSGSSRLRPARAPPMRQHLHCPQPQRRCRNPPRDRDRACSACATG